MKNEPGGPILGPFTSICLLLEHTTQPIYALIYDLEHHDRGDSEDILARTRRAVRDGTLFITGTVTDEKCSSSQITVIRLCSVAPRAHVELVCSWSRSPNTQARSMPCQFPHLQAPTKTTMTVDTWLK